MIPKLNRMLYATDLSASSIDGIPYAINYAIRHNATLIVFHVINQRSITCSKMLATFFNEGQEHKIRQEKINSAFKRMEDLLDIIRKQELNNHPLHANKIEHLAVHYGRIAEEIVEKANRWACELIILGPHRKGFWGRIFLPGISRKVIRRTDKRVHIIKLPKGEKL
jgi:nucleotide-binding universal stress UspA family protein